MADRKFERRTILDPAVASLLNDMEHHQSEAALPRRERHILEYLVRNAGKVLTHRQLLGEIWGPAYEDSTHTLRVHMASIRQKIESDPAHPRFIRTETGVGYRFLAT